MQETTVLFRPVGENELRLIAETGYKAFPPRLSGQPIFYPVLTEEYATQIARDWNAKNSASKVGYVTASQSRQNTFRNSRHKKWVEKFMSNIGYLPRKWMSSIRTSWV